MSRSMCSILKDMRECAKTKNFSYLEGLIEEGQYTANRMEAAISDQKDYKWIERHRAELKDELYQMYKLYVKRCKEIKIKPKKRHVYMSEKFELLDSKDGTRFFAEPKPKEKNPKDKTSAPFAVSVGDVEEAYPDEW